MSPTDNPLLSDSPQAWDALIESIGPASILVIIESRMSDGLRQLLQPEDVLQESLLHAWRDRAKCEWRGVKAFRAWLLSIINNRLREAADHFHAAKRGSGTPPVRFTDLAAVNGTGDSNRTWGPARSTTPSRIAIYREQTVAMKNALRALPPELGEVVRLRLFEELSHEEIARRLRISESAARYRFRTGAERYAAVLHEALVSRSIPMPSAALPPGAGDSSPVGG